MEIKDSLRHILVTVFVLCTVPSVASWSVLIANPFSTQFTENKGATKLKS